MHHYSLARVTGIYRDRESIHGIFSAAGMQFPGYKMPGHLTDPQTDWRNMLKADTEANDQLGWVDEKAGVARIPVKDAMDLIVEKGLPPVPVMPAEKK